MSGPSPAICCISTSRSSAGSAASDTASREIAAPRCGASAWEFVHVAVDDVSRLAYVEVLPDGAG